MKCPTRRCTPTAPKPASASPLTLDSWRMKVKRAIYLTLAFIIVMGCILYSCFFRSSTVTAISMERLGIRAAKGNMGAMDEIARIADDLYKNMDYANESKRVASNLVLMRAAFSPIGKKAGEGSTTALEALHYANRNRQLRSFTSDAFGIAAGMGNPNALDVLLHYKQHGYLLSSTVSAMKYAANRNIPGAVEFLVEVMETPKNKPLWHMASQGLVGAAAMGNMQAKELLQKYSEEEYSNRRVQAVGAKAPQPNP